MKKIFTLSILLLGLTSSAQSLPVDSTSGKLTYAQVFTLDSTYNTGKIFSICKEWIHNQNFIQIFDDLPSGKVAAGVTHHFGGSMFAMLANLELRHEVRFSCKDGRVKMIITDFKYINYSPDGSRLCVVGVLTTCVAAGNFEILIHSRCGEGNRKAKLFKFVQDSSLSEIESFKNFLATYKKSADW